MSQAEDPAATIRQLQLKISELERALAQAAQSESRYRSLIDYAGIGYATFNEFGEHLSTNPAYCAIVGVTEEDLLGRGLTGYLDEQSREIWLQVAEQSEKTESVTIQVKVVRPSGEMVPCLVNVNPVPLPGGIGIGHFASFSDISDLSRREAAIREREAQVRTLIETLGDGIVELDLHGRIHFANSAAEQLLEVKFSEMRDRPYTGVLRLCQDDGTPLRPEENPVARCLVHGKPVSSQQFLHTSAGLRSLDTSVMPLYRDNFNMGAVLVFRDVSEIQALSADFLSILDNSGDSMFIKDINGRYRVVNQQFALLHGFPHWRDMIGKSDFDLHPREVAEEFWKEDLDVIEKGQPLSGIIKPYIGLLGDQRYARTSKRPYFNARGRIIGVFGVASDITDLKNLNDQLSKAKEQAESATRAKSLFLASMSHEIRTPLNAVLGLSILLGRTSLDAKQRDYLEKIEAAGKTLTGVINDILDLSKIEAGRLELESVSLSLSEVLAGARGMIQPRCLEKGLNLVSEIDPEIPDLLVGDPLRITQVLMNLLSNAVKFTERGSIHMRTQLQSFQGPNCSVRIEISDTGIGIAPEDIPKLFQNFSQVDSSVTRRFGGTGLGLAISKKLVEMHGGKISVDSVPGQGTTFTFTLDFGLPQDGLRPQRSSETTYKDLSARLRSGRELRVLIVEDNEVNRLILEETLASEHITCLSAEGALEGIRLLEQSTQDGVPVDLVFMDLQMPDVDGFEAARRIRAERAWAQIPILAISADAFEQTLTRVRAAGMNALLPKPIAVNEVLSAVLYWTSPEAKLDSLEELPAIDEPGHEAAGAAGAVNGGPISGAAASGAATNGGTNSGTAIPSAPDGTQEPVSPLPAIEGLDLVTALRRIRGNRKLYQRLLTSFSASYPPERIEILRTSDPSTSEGISWLADFAHGLRGAASNLGADKITRLSSDLQHVARAGDTARCKVIAPELALELERVGNEIRAWQDSRASGAGSAQAGAAAGGATGTTAGNGPAQGSRASAPENGAGTVYNVASAPDAVLGGQTALILQALIGFLIQNDSRAGRLARELFEDLAPGPQKVLAQQIVASCDEFDYATSLDLARQLQ